MTVQLFIAFILLLILLIAARYFKHHHKDAPIPINEPNSASNKTSSSSLSQTSDTPNENESTLPEIPPMSEVLNTALEEALFAMKDCQAIAYADIQEKRLLGAQSHIAFPSEIIAFAAGAVTELFTAPNLMQVANAFKIFKGQAADKSNLNEIMIRGEGNLYIFLRAHSNPCRACVFVYAETDENSSNFGLMLHQARAQMPQIEVAAEAAFLVE